MSIYGLRCHDRGARLHFQANAAIRFFQKIKKASSEFTTGEQKRRGRRPMNTPTAAYSADMGGTQSTRGHKGRPMNAKRALRKRILKGELD